MIAARRRRATLSIVKAGGVDVLDLMKEGLLAPARVVNLRDAPGLDAIEAGADGCLRIGAMATLARLARARRRAQGASRRWPTRVADSASPQIRNVATLGGNLLQRPRCWYFRAADFRCLRKGGGHCFAIPGDNRYHAIFDNRLCAIVHPSTAATALVALGASIELIDAEGEHSAKFGSKISSSLRIATCSARTTCGRMKSSPRSNCRLCRRARAWRM